MLIPSASVELIWQDETGSRAMTTYLVPSSYTVEEAFLAANAVIEASSALTGCTLVGTRVKYRSAPFDPVLVTGTPIVETGVFFFATSPSTPDGAIVVHAIDSAILKTDGPTAGYGIDLTNPDVIAFVDAVLSLPASNPFGDVFTDVIVAYKQSRV